MALPAPQQGGLGAMSAQPPQVNPDAVEANLVEEKQKEPSYAEKAVADRAAASKELDRQINVLRAGLERRMTPAFDPALMKLAAGFLKPTRTGSFGESAGYAAEGYADENEKQIARDAQIQKMHMELLEKQQALRSQSVIDQYTLNRFGNKAPAGMMQTSAPQGSPAPQGTPMGGAPAPAPKQSSAMSLMPGQMPTSPTVGRTSPTGGAIEMQPITDAQIAEANLIDTSGKLAKQLTEEAKLQREDVIMIDGKPYSRATRQFLPGSPDTMIERDFGRFVGPKKVPMWFAAQYDAVKSEAIQQNRPELVFEFLKKHEMIEKPRTGDSGKPEYETPADEKLRKELMQKRAEAQIGEEKGQITALETNARTARDTSNLTKDIRATAESNKKAFDLLNNPGIADAVKRAAERGITAGSLGNFSIPARELESYTLSGDDRQALQLMAQKMSQLTVQFRKSAMAPGEGATTESEGRLYAELGALPSDTAKVIRLKMEALDEKAKYDQQVFVAWNKFSKNPENTYRDFLASAYEPNSALNNINEAYDARLEKMRKNNADLFRTSPKAPESKPAASSSAPSAPPTVSGDNDPAYKRLQPGEQYIFNGKVMTKK
jgi:hypothetical protein